MEWTEEELDYMKENYPSNPNLKEMSKHLKRNRKAIQHKGARMRLSRDRFSSNKPSNRELRDVIDKRYYEENKSDIYRRKMDRRKRLKGEAVKVSGGKCKNCGYDKCLSALEFHHQQKNKEGNVSTLLKNQSRQKLLKEVGKCILLCANCHRELHYNGSVG